MAVEKDGIITSYTLLTRGGGGGGCISLKHLREEACCLWCHYSCYIGVTVFETFVFTAHATIF